MIEFIPRHLDPAEHDLDSGVFEHVVKHVS